MNTSNNFPAVFSLGEQAQFHYILSIIFLSLRAKYEFQHIEIGIFKDY